MRLIEYASLDSTNLEARRLWAGNPAAARPEPLAVVAAAQTAGMGRSGRSWVSPTGGLWLSLAWPLRRPLEAYQALPLAAGLAVARALEGLYALDCRIKWPNDLLVRNRKLVGILCQGEPDLPSPAVIVGIGVNANFPAAALGPGLRQPPTSLRDELRRDVPLARLRDRLLDELEEALADFEQDLWRERLLPEIERRLAWRGRPVRCTDTQQQLLAQGLLTGLDAQGCLLIQTPGGPQALAVGELQRLEHDDDIGPEAPSSIPDA